MQLHDSEIRPRPMLEVQHVFGAHDIWSVTYASTDEKRHFHCPSASSRM